jgi:hypothetical protein
VTDAEKWRTVFSAPIEPAPEKASPFLAYAAVAVVGGLLLWASVSDSRKRARA